MSATMLFSSTNTWKSFDSIGEEYFVGSSVQADTLTKKSTEELTNKDIYVKQPEGNVQCTLYSTVMMLRRDAILDGDTNWKEITVDSVEQVAWSGSGLLYEFTYDDMNVKTTANTLDPNLSTEEKKKVLIEALQQHPEGIVFYVASYNAMHAVLLTSYDADSDTFYCYDPAMCAPDAIIPIMDSSYATTYHIEDMDTLIASMNYYWYVE